MSKRRLKDKDISKRNNALKKILERMGVIRQTDPHRLTNDEVIKLEIEYNKLDRQLKTFCVKRDDNKSNVPLPASYIEEKKKIREKARGISGRDKVRANFVQGGPAGVI